MATTTYFDHVLDPATGQTIEVCDKYAREQLVHKVEKTIVNSLPSKPTNYEDWLDMEPFLYYVPISGQPNEYQVWTLFFTGDPTDPSDYTDPNNYEWAQIADTDVDLNNFSTKGHTHEVIPEVEVDDHNYTPQGQVVSEFEGGTSTTSENTHDHSFTPEGNVSGEFSGSPGTTGNSTTGVGLNKSKKKLTTKKLNISPATAVNFTGSTTNAQRATGALETLSTYDASKAVFNGIDVQDGVLSFVTKKMSTADTVSSLQASVDASKVSFDSQGTVTNQDIATGAVEDDANGALLGVGTEITDSGHTHSFTPTGQLANLAFTGTAGTTGSNTHTHTLQAAGRVLSAFRGLRANLKHKVDSKKVRTSPDEYDPSGNVFDWYGIEFDENGSDPIKPRIGNMDMHRMLPIQTKMRRCILNDDGTVNYYLDDRDSTKRAGSQEGYVTSEETFMSKVETDEIRDETEEIGVIKGNTGELNQLVDSSTTSVTVVSGHKYMSVINGTKNIATSSGTAITGLTGGTDMIFDLTLMGIDSFTTVEQVEAYLAENFGQRSYYPYNEGTLLSNTMKGIQTVGFNKWDEEWEEGGLNGEGEKVGSSTQIRCKSDISVFPNTEYYVGDKTYIITEYDSSGNFISRLKYGGATITITTSSNARYLRFCTLVGYGTTYNHDICINISDPAKNGTYEPYNLHSYQRDVTQITGINPNTGERETIFPNGMRGAGSVKDRIYIEGGVVKAAVNVGSVDLGTLSFMYNDTETGRFDCNIPLENIMGTTSSLEVPNIICSKYMTGRWANHSDLDKCVLLDGNLLRIKDSAYSDATTFKTAMSGVMLNYGLATPIIYTDLQWGDGSPVILPIEIEAEKNATIDIVSNFDKPDTLMAAPTLQMKKYVLTQGANLDGSDGQVMVEIPEHWRKVYTYLNGSTSMVRAMVSPYPQEGSGWIHVKKGYVSAYEASIIAGKLCSVSNIVDLTLSVVNGKIQASCDVSTATGQSDITSQLPTTNQTMDTFRTAARARGNEGEFKWNENVYEQNIAWIWLYWIEYANLNSQADFVSALDANGYHQGGLGAGVTTISSGNWSSFNGYKPFVPCGITNCLGNQTGEVYLAIPSGLGGGTVKVNSYRGIELPFGHIWKFADGIKYLGDGSKQSVLRCNNPADYSSASASTGYTSIGDNYGGDGWKTKIMIGDDGDINCKAVGGSSNQAYCDYNYQAHANGTYYCCLLGSTANYGASAGLGCVRSDLGFGSSVNVGSRLSYFNK